MRTKILIPALCIMGLFVFSVRAQQQNPDNLKHALEMHPAQDTTRLGLLLEMAGVIVRSNPRSALTYCDEALTLARYLKEKKWEIKSLNLQGQAYSYLDNTEQFEKSYHEAIRLALEINDSVELARNTGHLGTAMLNSGNANKALPLYLQSEAMYENLGLREQQAVVRDNLGATYSILGNYQESLNCHMKALSYYEEFGKESRLPNCYMNIGNVFNYLEEDEKAREYYEKSLARYRNMKDPGGIAMVSTNLGITYMNHPDKSIAFRYFLDAYEYHLSLSDFRNMTFEHMNMAHMLNNMCETDFEMLRSSGAFRGVDAGAKNQYELALKFLNSNLEYFQKTQNWLSYTFTVLLIGETHIKLNQYDKALSLLYQTLVMSDTLSLLDHQRLALKKISQVYESMGQYDSALYYYQKHIIIRDSLNNNQKLKEIQRKEMQYEFESREKELVHEKEVSDLNASLAQQLAQQHLLRLKTSEQALLLQSQELDISHKEQEMSHLAYLQKMAELQVADLEKRDKAKKLALLKREHDLTKQKVKNRSLQRDISWVVIGTSLIFLAYVFRNFRKQRRHNRQLDELNAAMGKLNLQLQGSNEELSFTLGQLKTTQAQLVETEKQKEKELIRRRIAQDMHDEISSGLTKIVWLCEMAGKKVAQADYQTVTGVIDRIADSSRETVERIGEIIWAIDPDRDNLEGFYAYLRTYIMEYFEPTGYAINVDFPEKKSDTRFNPDVKRALFVVIKEALHNVVKHAHGDRVDVVFRVVGSGYEITVGDNGRGMGGVESSRTGSGLRNMQRRMEEVAGTFSIVPNGGKGTCIRLSGPVAGA